MTVLIYLPAGQTTTVTGVTVVVRRQREIVCLHGRTVLATFPHATIVAYALVPDPPVDAAAAAPALPSTMWAKLAPLLAAGAPRRSGRPQPCEPRLVLDAILYQRLTGCSWAQLRATWPQGKAVYRTYQRWRRSGLLAEILATIRDDTQAEAEPPPS